MSGRYAGGACFVNMYLSYLFKIVNSFLRIGYIPSSGRNFSGKICIRHQGGSRKRCYLYVDFFRRLNLVGVLSKIKKTSLYTGYLGLMLYQNGLSNYILLSENMHIGQLFYFGVLYNSQQNSTVKSVISSCLLSSVPLFSLANNVEVLYFAGGQLARAAGTSVIIIVKGVDKVSLKLKSGWNLTLSAHNICSVGSVSNSLHRFRNLSKAGQNRALGIRPTVRGVAMNPCDHPHGGGEGRKSPPAAQRSLWG